MLWALLAVLGGGLLTATLNAAGVRVEATPAELVLWGAAGVLFARLFASGALALALPILLAGIELLTGAPGVAAPAEAGDPLTLALFYGRRLPATTIVFAAAYGTWAQHFGLRTTTTCAALVAVLLTSVVLDGQLPTVTLLGGALLVVNADRLGRLLRTG